MPTSVLEIPSPAADTLQAMLDASPGYQMLVDTEHRIVMANVALADMISMHAEAMRGRLCHEVVHGTHEAFAGCPLEAALERGCGVERTLFDHDNKLFLRSWVRPTRFTTAKGSRLYLHGTRDITREMQVERAAALQAKRNEALARILSLSVQPGTLRSIARGALEIITGLPGLSLQRKGAVFLTDPSGECLWMLASLNLPQKLRVMCRRVNSGHCHCGRVLSTRSIQFVDRIDDRHDVRYPGMTPHGHYCIPIRCDDAILGVLNLYVPHGHAHSEDEANVLQAAADVLGGVIRRAMERQRRAESEARFRALAEASHDAIILLEADGRPLFWNAAAERCFGRSHEQMSTIEDIAWLFDDESAFEVRNAIEQDADHDLPQLRRWRGVRHDGESFPVEASVYKVALGSRGLVAVAVRDRSETEQLEAALVQRERLVASGMISASIAHEVNSPLASMMLNLEFARDLISDLRTSPKLTPIAAQLGETIDELAAAAEHIGRISRSVSNLARTNEMAHTEVDLREVVRQSMSLLGRQLRANVNLRLELPDELPLVRGNTGQLIQVLLNLAANALNAMDDQPWRTGKLTISCNVRRQHVYLEIRDDGPGIPEHLRPRLFEPFTSTRTDRGGTGLGLWICADIVRAHGGSIEHDPKVGPGALFRVRLPRIDQAVS